MTSGHDGAGDRLARPRGSVNARPGSIVLGCAEGLLPEGPTRVISWKVSFLGLRRRLQPEPMPLASRSGGEAPLKELLL